MLVQHACLFSCRTPSPSLRSRARHRRGRSAKRTTHRLVPVACTGEAEQEQARVVLSAAGTVAAVSVACKGLGLAREAGIAAAFGVGQARQNKRLHAAPVVTVYYCH